MSGQRKLNAGHHFVISPALLLPLSRSLSAGMGHGAICAQPPLRPMAYRPVARGGTQKIQIQRNRTITRLRPSGFHRARARGDVVDAFRFTDRLSEDGRRLLWARRSVNQGPQMDAGPDRAQKVRQPLSRAKSRKEKGNDCTSQDTQAIQGCARKGDEANGCQG